MTIKLTHSVKIAHASMFNSLNAELNPICQLLALLGAHHIFHVSRVRVKKETIWASSFVQETCIQEMLSTNLGRDSDQPELFSWFSSAFQQSADTTTYTTPRPPPSVFFPIRHSFITTAFGVVESQLPTAWLHKPQTTKTYTRNVPRILIKFGNRDSH